MIPSILWFPAALGITSDLLQTPDFLSFPFTVHHPWPEIATHSSWSGRSWSLHLNVTSSERSCLVTLLFSFGAFITMCDCGFLNLVTRWTQLHRGRDASVLSLFIQSNERMSIHMFQIREGLGQCGGIKITQHIPKLAPIVLWDFLNRLVVIFALCSSWSSFASLDHSSAPQFYS